MSSPEYVSCNEDSIDYREVFQSKGSFIPNIKCNNYNIDYYLKDAIEHANFDSDLSIVAFPGCLRIGKLFVQKLLNGIELGLSKDNLIEIPIFLIPKFIRDVNNCLIYLLNKGQNFKASLKTIGETTHQKFLLSKKYSIGQQRAVTFQLKLIDKILYEITFTDYYVFKAFSNKLFHIVLESTNPIPVLQVIVINFINKLKSKAETIINPLFDFWIKLKKLDILWNAVSEVVFEIENKENEHLTNLSFNYIKKNIEIIQELRELSRVND